MTVNLAHRFSELFVANLSNRSQTALAINFVSPLKPNWPVFNSLWSNFLSLIWVVALKLILALLLLINYFGSNAVAQAGSEQHTHGIAHLTIAYDNGALEAQFESPAMSLFGFEHQPKTPSQIEVVENVKALLESDKKIFLFDGANCVSSHVKVDILGPAGRTLGDRQKLNHHNTVGTHLAHNEVAISHSEAKATYVFNCVNEPQLQAVTVFLFEHFSGLEKITVSWVTQAQQGETVLHATSSTIKLN